MTNTSANSAGYLPPIASVGTYDNVFVAFLQSVVAGITALDPTLVRPRWQTTPPNQPAASVDWASVGVTDERPLALRPVTWHDPNGEAGDGADVIERTVRDSILVSFYGPDAWGNSSLLADGIAIEQNRYAMRTANVVLQDIGRRTYIPELVNNNWLPRVDMVLIFDRTVQRTYPIMNLLSAHGTIVTAPTGNPTAVTTTDFDTLDDSD